MELSIRLAGPADYPAFARVLAAEMGEWAPGAEELAHDDATRDPARYHAAFVAEDGAAGAVGVASVGHDERAHREGKFVIDIRVPPELQGRGIGAALYNAIMRHLEPLGPRELETSVWETLERAVRFVTDRGFVEAWRRVDSHLDVAGFDWTPYAGLEDRVAARGIRVATFAELAAEPDLLPRLHALDCALWRDVPYGEPVTPAPAEQFAAGLVQHPDFLPDALFIALRGGELVGYSQLTRGDGSYLNTDMTGVLPHERGAGLATLLKLRGVRYAQERGVPRLTTVNDSVNAAMLALNRRLGFQRDGGTIRFVRRLGAERSPAPAADEAPGRAP